MLQWLIAAALQHHRCASAHDLWAALRQAQLVTIAIPHANPYSSGTGSFLSTGLRRGYNAPENSAQIDDEAGTTFAPQRLTLAPQMSRMSA